jgi:hypothetical protein
MGVGVRNSRRDQSSKVDGVSPSKKKLRPRNHWNRQNNLSSSVAIAQVCNNLYQNPETPHLKFLLFSLSKFRKNKKAKILMVKNFPF